MKKQYNIKQYNVIELTENEAVNISGGDYNGFWFAVGRFAHEFYNTLGEFDPSYWTYG